MKAIVFTEQSISHSFNTCTFDNYSDLDFVDENNFQYEIEGIKYIITTGSKDRNFTSNPLIIIEDVRLFELNNEIINDCLQKLHRVSIHCQRTRTRTLPPWTIYHYANKIVISIGDGREEYKVFLEHSVNKSHDIVLFKITDSKNTKIEDYFPDTSIYDTIIQSKQKIYKFYNDFVDQKKIHEFENDYSFDLVYNDKEQSHYTYEQWIGKLNHIQKAFVNKSAAQAIKLKGPAGTGKTLAMQLKAAKLLKENPDSKILYLSHSWTVASQVQSFFDKILIQDELKRIDVFPLLTIAEEKATRNAEIVTIGDDSLSGKIQQLNLISGIINNYINSDWIIYKPKCTSAFVEYVESTINLELAFTWDVMLEIACVIGANGIMPVLNGPDRYKKIERRPWMMHLANDYEKDVIFDIYKLLMRKLQEDKKITTDQIINDYINYLSTYNWFYDRAQNGYDFIFIDEMQLFNEQERLSFHFLTKNPNEYPKLFMALDPKQSILETYCNYGLTNVSTTSNPTSETSFGQIEDILLDEAYRYTPQILDFLKHIDSSYPALGLSSDWNNKISKSKSRRPAGNNVSIQLYNDLESEIDGAYEIAKNYLSKGMRTAILVLQFEDYTQFLKSDNFKGKCEIVQSKNDTLKLAYTKKRIVLSQPYYVIGLQFDAVILASCYCKHNFSDPNQGYNNRRFISDLYLGASRSKLNLLLTSHSSNAFSIPSFIEQAIKKGIIKERGI